jgi:hypothetical protein
MTQQDKLTLTAQVYTEVAASRMSAEEGAAILADSGVRIRYSRWETDRIFAAFIGIALGVLLTLTFTVLR